MKKALKYIGLFMFGVIAFPILLFLNWKNKDKDYKNYLIASGVGFAFFLIGGIFEEDTETDTNVTDNAEQVEEEPAEVPEEQEGVEEEPRDKEAQGQEQEKEATEKVPEENDNGFEVIGEKVFGDNYEETNILWDYDNIEYDDDGEIDESNSEIEAITVNIVDISSQQGSFLISVKDYLEEVKESEFDDLYIVGYGNFVDQYGEESEQKAISISLSKESIGRINFDNFDWRNLPNIAEEYFAHESMNDFGM